METITSWRGPDVLAASPPYERRARRKKKTKHTGGNNCGLGRHRAPLDKWCRAPAKQHLDGSAEMAARARAPLPDALEPESGAEEEEEEAARAGTPLIPPLGD